MRPSLRESINELLTEASMLMRSSGSTYREPHRTRDMLIVNWAIVAMVALFVLFLAWA